MMEYHELAKAFPQLQGEAFDELVADVKENGLREAITTHEGKILDGVNRHRACEKAGVKAEFTQLQGHVDPVGFVISMNLKRRHLSVQQRASIGSDILKYAKDHPESKANRPEEPTEAECLNSDITPTSEAEVAEVMNVPRSSVALVSKIKREGTIALNKAITDDRISLSAAERALKLSPEDQDEVASQKTKSAANKILKAKLEELTPSGDSESTSQSTEASEDPVVEEDHEEPENRVDLNFKGLLNPNTIVDTSLADVTEFDSAPLHTLEHNDGYSLIYLPDSMIATLKEVVLEREEINF